MTLSFTATGASVFTPGPYRARLVKIEKKFKLREKVVTDIETGEKVVRKVGDPYLRWVFEIVEEGYEGKSLSVLSGASFGFQLSGDPAKARRFAQALLGRDLEDGEKFTDEDLYGLEAILHVDIEKSDRGQFAKVVEIAAVPKDPTVQKAPEEDDLSEDDVQDMNGSLG